MPRIPVPAAGGAPIIPYLRKSIRLVSHGCRNRPFYHIVVLDTNQTSSAQPIEQVGSYDPMPNERQEKLVAFNFERIRYWMGEGVQLSPQVQQLLGLSGFLPIHPRSYMLAWRRRGEEPAQKVSTWLPDKKQEIIMKVKKYREEKAARESEAAQEPEQVAQSQ